MIQKSSMSLYEFEFRFLPYFTELCQTWKISYEDLASKDFIMGQVAANYPSVDWNWEQFHVEKVNIMGNRCVAFTFPEPNDPPLARFAIARIGGDVTFTGEDASYNTLELGENGTWYLCRQSTKEHSNYGVVSECKSLEEFILQVEIRIMHTKTPDGKRRLLGKLFG